MIVKRRVIKLGTKTLLVSIPSQWARQHGIGKGHELDVQMQGSSLIVKGNAQKTPPLSIDISDFNSSLIWYTLISAYRQGTDTIEISYNSQTIWDKRQLKNVQVTDLLHTITERLIGFGITKTSSNKCVIKDLSAGKPEEFANSVTRTFQTVLSFGEDLANAIENNENHVVETLAERGDRQVNRMVDFSLRLLSKHQPANLSVYHLLVNLEGAGDILRDIAVSAKESWTGTKQLKEVTLLLRKCYEYYLSPSREKILDIEAHKTELRNATQKIPAYERALIQQFEKFVLESLTSYAVQSASISRHPDANFSSPSI